MGNSQLVQVDVDNFSDIEDACMKVEIVAFMHFHKEEILEPESSLGIVNIDLEFLAHSL